MTLQSRDSYEYFATEHFRLSGVYWGLCALHLLGRADQLDAEELVAWVLSCQRPGGGFGGSERHDPHLLYTLSALQVLALCGALHSVDADAVAACEPLEGAWWRNSQARAAPCCAAVPARRRNHTAAAVLLLLTTTPPPAPRPPAPRRHSGPAAARRLILGRPVGRGGHAVQLLRAVRALVAGPAGCRRRPRRRPLSGRLQELRRRLWLHPRCARKRAGGRWVGGAGPARCLRHCCRTQRQQQRRRRRPAPAFTTPAAHPAPPPSPPPATPPAGNESHAGQVFTCVAALAIAGRLDLVDADLLGWWCVWMLGCWGAEGKRRVYCARQCCPVGGRSARAQWRRRKDGLCPAHPRAGWRSGRRAAAGSTGGPRSCRTCATAGGASARCPSWGACTGSTARRCRTSSWTARWVGGRLRPSFGSAWLRACVCRGRASACCRGIRPGPPGGRAYIAA